MRRIIRWGALWRSQNNLDGITEYIICVDCKPILFRTRQECRKWINEKYGYIGNRSDLKREPHGWKIPKAVKVKIGTL